MQYSVYVMYLNISYVYIYAMRCRIISLASNSLGTSFACSAAGRLRCSGPSADTLTPRVGKLSLWDLKTMKVEVG